LRRHAHYLENILTTKNVSVLHAKVAEQTVKL